jgi:hypothetical protein
MLGIIFGKFVHGQGKQNPKIFIFKAIELAWCISSKDSSTHFNLLNQTPKPNFAIIFVDNRSNTLT